MKKKSKKRKRRNRSNSPVRMICLLILLLIVVGAAAFLIKRYMPTREKMDLNEYYGSLSDGEAALILGTQILEERGAVDGDNAYLPLDVVNTYLNQRFYWDGDNGQILYATPSELLSFAASADPGGDVWSREGKVYLNLSLIAAFTDMDTFVYQDPARIAVQYSFKGVNTAAVIRGGAVRYRGGIKSPILTQVEKGDSLILMEELEEWAQVATRDGYIGYIEKSRIGASQIVDEERDFQAEETSPISMDVPVNLSWHQVTTYEANSNLSGDIAEVTGVNVISPTWFSILDNAGNINSLASSDYVSAVHERGMQVWGLIDNFSPDISTVEVLSHTSSRQNLISQLVNTALDVGLDGINIDFEALSEECGIHFLEFLRELSIETHKNNLVLSVDNPVPQDFTSHYDRSEQGRVVDYVIMMGYDEHYSGSETAGSVASLPWVEQGVMDTLSEVPAEKVILAIPFYTRLWKTTAGTLSSEAIGMDRAAQEISSHQVQTYWDNNAGQNYGTYESEGSTFQIWLEDAQSIAEKVKLVPKYGLAGVAQWKLGFQNSAIWQVIEENLG